MVRSALVARSLVAPILLLLLILLTPLSPTSALAEEKGGWFVTAEEFARLGGKVVEGPGIPGDLAIQCLSGEIPGILISSAHHYWWCPAYRAPRSHKQVVLIGETAIAARRFDRQRLVFPLIIPANFWVVRVLGRGVEIGQTCADFVPASLTDDSVEWKVYAYSYSLSPEGDRCAPEISGTGTVVVLVDYQTVNVEPVDWEEFAPRYPEMQVPSEVVNSTPVSFLPPALTVSGQWVGIVAILIGGMLIWLAVGPSR
ncbi:hypothetical protein [Thermogutta sp.]|uniref:hypothetical protein n=1 Tax=Thermogutta sp. TaxID=1962930 RepID=UPI00321FEE76